MHYKLCFLLLAFLSFSITSNAQPKQIAILDLTDRNSESNEARLISCRHLMDVVGIPYIVTSDIQLASTGNMILCTSFLANSTFTAEEDALIEAFVSSGGLLVAPRIEGNQLYKLFGITGSVSSKSRYNISWDTSLNTSSLDLINEPEEQVVSLGSTTIDEIIKTIGYSVDNAQTLAKYEDGSSAVTKNAFGIGHAVSLGISWKDIILRNQINRDFEAQRITSNGFEPTTDVFMLFVRRLYLELNPYGVWKNSSPGNSKSTLKITHDVDSGTGMDSLFYFVDYEQDKQIEATYNITLKYFNDALSSDFYNNHQEELDYILSKGHQIQSHSVGHFFDFADASVIPIGAPGNTKENYTPYNNGDVTVGATVYGECEVSKNELENDLNIHVRSFRAGHLAYPKDLIEVLENLDYEYNSSFTACDVLTNFPYQNVRGMSFSQGLSSIYELPVTISDVFSDDPISSDNIFDKADIWLETTLKNADNGAPTVLLIHPNRQYKLEGLKYFMAGLQGEGIHTMEMGLFGDFWKSRKAFQYSSNLVNNKLTITIPRDQELESNVSLVVNNGQDLSEIIVINDANEVIDFREEDWSSNDIILYLDDSSSNTVDVKNYDDTDLKVYPNPTQDHFTLQFNADTASEVNLSLVDMYGEKIFHQNSYLLSQGMNTLRVDLDKGGLAPGTYILLIENQSGIITTRKVLLM